MPLSIHSRSSSFEAVIARPSHDVHSKWASTRRRSCKSGDTKLRWFVVGNETDGDIKGGMGSGAVARKSSSDSYLGQKGEGYDECLHLYDMWKCGYLQMEHHKMHETPHLAGISAQLHTTHKTRSSIIKSNCDQLASLHFGMDCSKSNKLCSRGSSSSPSSSTAWKYDVFVSFRGEDIRFTFADQLFFAFQKKDILAFRDDSNIKQGDHISTELEQAIEGSQVLMVVFSKNYATSTWCLEELAKFVDCIAKVPTTGQTVLPVFYDVSPSEVRKQSGEHYGKAFAELEQKFKHDLGMVRRWREALAQVAALSGCNVQNKPQHREIEKIVDRVINIVGYKLSSFDGLVGMHSRVEQLEKLLDLKSNDDVRSVGIRGMGGIGKTTLARAVYDRNFHQYDTSCYIDDVSKVYHDCGAVGVQKQLIYQVLNQERQDIWNISKATYLIKTRLRHLKAFIVLDNVDNDEQLKKLGLNPKCLCAGSRIIVISRDQHILKSYGVDEVYDGELMNKDEAHELFCRKAFKYDYIMGCNEISRDYETLIDLALEYAQGLPLAIEVLGSFLYNKGISEWQSALTRLRDSSNKDIMDVLQISFDGLEPKEKEIFLDIACFFKNNDGKNFVEKILDYCGFDPIIGIRVLEDKSLITIQNWEIRMHDKLRELGRKIVRQPAPNELGKWSRLWLLEDFQNILYSKMAMNNLESIRLEFDEEMEEDTTLRAEVLSKMNHLRLLLLDNINFSGSLNCLSNELRYLQWDKYPFTYFPSSCELNKLVELHLPCSSIKQLWEGVKPLCKLKIMDLSYSKDLVKTPDFTGAPNLEQLNLEGCTKLEHVHPSIGNLAKLVFLNLNCCASLTSLSNNISCVSSLEVVKFGGCSKLFHSGLPETGRHGIRETTIQCMSTSSIFKRLKLMLPSSFFNSRRHGDVVDSLKHSLSRLQCLRWLDLSYCNLLNIPDVMTELYCLEELNLEGNNLVTLPSFMKKLPRLVWLKLDHCKQLTSLCEFPLGTIVSVRNNFFCLEYSAELRMFNCPKLVEMGGSWSSSIVFSWMIQLLKVHKESSPFITIVIPGTEIPSWFNQQSVDSSMMSEPIPDVHDSNWIGFAYCAAFVTQYHPPSPSDAADRRNPWIECSFGYARSSYIRLVAKVIERDGVTGELVHLCLLYFPRQLCVYSVMKDAARHDDCGLHFKLYSHDEGVHVEVKQWGVRAVYKQDLEEQLNGDDKEY